MRATIGITSGDPAGVGLEVILKALPHVADSAQWVLFTTRCTFERHRPSIEYRWIESLDQISGDPVLHVHAVSDDDPDIAFGQLSAAAGAEALACLEAAGSA